jgi:hypothetical protein
MAQQGRFISEKIGLLDSLRPASENEIMTSTRGDGFIKIHLRRCAATSSLRSPWGEWPLAPTILCAHGIVGARGACPISGAKHRARTIKAVGLATFYEMIRGGGMKNREPLKAD